MAEETTSFLIKDIPSEDWEKFKNKIPRNKTINERLLEIIEEEGKK